MSGLSHDDIHKEVEKIQTVEMDIRILEGIALPTILARQFLNAAGRYDLMETVLNYIKDVLIPYHKEIINPSIRDVADTPTPNLMKTLLNICTSQQGNGVTTIVNSTLAVKSDSIKDPSLRKKIQALGGKLNHSVRLNGKPKKCVTIPKTSMTEEQWKSVASAMLKAVPPPTTTDRAAVPPPTTTDRAAVPPPTTTDEAAVPPPTTTDRAAVPPPTTTDEAAVPPPTTTDEAAVPPPTTTDEAAVPPPTTSDRADRAAVPPPTTTDRAAVPPPTTTDEAAVPPPTTTNEAALPAQATHRTVPQLPFPIQKLQKKTITTCFKCKKVGSKFLHWVACDGCRKWYHRKCTTLSCKDYLKLTEDSVWNCDICIV
ncbi:mucin-7-like isoform X2 [Ostrea edulis]|uniref:mucin-7-like isoform X2 n=1 Tax=Ostrea edulis TaxID=37623 RepID=UPI0024AFDC28|nr:mucin-7-like isoform X2 [Ostrea edulis]